MYKNICKDIFIDRYEQSDIIVDQDNFLRKIEELKSYMVEFFENGAMKPKVYFFNCIIRDKNCQ